MRHPLHLRRSLPVLLAGIAGVLVMWLCTRSRDGGVGRQVADRRAAVVAADGATDELRVVEASAEEQRTPLSREPAPALEAQPNGEPSAACLTPFDYGVTGRVGYRGAEPATRLRGTLRAVGALGEEVSDSFDSRGEFGLWELGPGPWTVVIDLGVQGFVEATVLLTPSAPEAVLELWLEPPVAVEVEVRTTLPSDPVPRAVRSGLSVVAHHEAAQGERTWFASLDAVSTAGLWRSTRSRPGVFRGSLPLPRDETLSLSLFANDLLIASRVREAGELRVVWSLGAEEFPPRGGKLSVFLIDEASGAPVEGFVRSVGWRAPRLDPTGAEAVVFDPVAPGWRQIEVGGGPHELLRRSIFVAPDAEVVETIRLRRGVSIAGRVRSPADEPALATLAAWRRTSEQGPVDPSSLRTTRSDLEGRFRFDSLSPGSYLLRSLGVDDAVGESAPGEGRWASRFVEVSALRDLEGVRIELEAVATLVLARSPARQEAIAWHLEDPRGRWVRQGELEDGAPRALHLPPGNYRLVAEDASLVRELELGASVQRVEL